MDILHIDIETYSEFDLTEVDLKKYISSPHFQIILIAWNLNDTETKIIDLMQDTNLTTTIPEFLNMLCNPDIKKVAHNAFFEFTCLQKAYPYGTPQFNIRDWDCTMQMAYNLNLPGGLGQLGEVLHLDKKKIEEGKELIRFFCKPCKPTRVNGQTTRNLPIYYPQKWELFKNYCCRDVDVEIQIYNKLSWFKPTDFEKNLWRVDYKINNNGVFVDTKLINNAIEADTAHKDYIKNKLHNLTGLVNPNSLVQLKEWIKSIEGVYYNSLDKTVIDGVIEKCKSEVVKEVLTLRKQLGKTSVAKYQNALNCIHEERLHFLFRHNYAFTGRWAGTFVQPHNLPRNKLEAIDVIRNKYLNKEYDVTDPTIPFELSQLVRTVFIPRIWHKFIIVDYSQIESRIAAWIAGEDWVLDAFENGRDIYVETASKMFDLPREEIDDELRQDGKRAVLACGYGGGIGAVDRFAPELTEEKKAIIVDFWRAANPNICHTWHTLDQGVKRVIADRNILFKLVINQSAKITIYQKKGCLFIQLPSGRSIVYPRVSLGKGDFGPEINYESVNGTTKQWEVTKTYGGKLFENICQAIARDILALALVRLDHEGYRICLHIHDEIVCEANETNYEEALKKMESLMCKPAFWSEGLPLDAKGFVSNYYMKES